LSQTSSGLFQTARQENILQIALEKGFEFPKRITLRQLAKAHDISPTTLSEILRGGQKGVFEEHFRPPTVRVGQENILPPTMITIRGERSPNMFGTIDIPCAH